MADAPFESIIHLRESRTRSVGLLLPPQSTSREPNETIWPFARCLCEGSRTAI